VVVLLTFPLRQLNLSQHAKPFENIGKVDLRKLAMIRLESSCRPRTGGETTSTGHQHQEL
jgi:hypothetical protein